MKNNVINYALEGFVLSLLNLAFLAIVNHHGSYYFQVDGSHIIEDWYIPLALFTCIITFLCMKLKKVDKKKRKILMAVYTVVPIIVDMAFRSHRTIDYEESNPLLWMFIIIVSVWTLLRYEVAEYIK